ncbi:hypothetical protein PM082_003912 [Marasmius tenuissimus]|nr:hypothetical protein PM082_003912 [Marasmius tenuissimus]
MMPKPSSARTNDSSECSFLNANHGISRASLGSRPRPRRYTRRTHYRLPRHALLPHYGPANSYYPTIFLPRRSIALCKPLVIARTEGSSPEIQTYAYSSQSPSLEDAWSPSPTRDWESLLDLGPRTWLAQGGLNGSGSDLKR